MLAYVILFLVASLCAIACVSLWRSIASTASDTIKASSALTLKKREDEDIFDTFASAEPGWKRRPKEGEVLTPWGWKGNKAKQVSLRSGAGVRALSGGHGLDWPYQGESREATLARRQRAAKRRARENRLRGDVTTRKVKAEKPWGW